MGRAPFGLIGKGGETSGMWCLAARETTRDSNNNDAPVVKPNPNAPRPTVNTDLPDRVTGELPEQKRCQEPFSGLLAAALRDLPHAELDALRQCLEGARPFGGDAWVQRTAGRLGLETTLRPRGRPKKTSNKGS